jgi:hypothetical protein
MHIDSAISLLSSVRAGKREGRFLTADEAALNARVLDNEDGLEQFKCLLLFCRRNLRQRFFPLLQLHRAQRGFQHLR